MSVKTDTFGGVQLSGQDAEKFIRQVKYGRVNQKAVELAVRGRNSAVEYAEKGFATVPLNLQEKRG